MPTTLVLQNIENKFLIFLRNNYNFYIPVIIILFCFIFTNILGFIDDTAVAYWSGNLLDQTYRIISAHFFHGDIIHLLTNVFGLWLSQHFFFKLNLEQKKQYLFLILVCLSMFLQTITMWFLDIIIFKNRDNLVIGFSGILFAINSFILLISTYGKKTFLNITINMDKNNIVKKDLGILTVIGFIFSFLPDVSLIAHISGFTAGYILFLL